MTVLVTPANLLLLEMPKHFVPSTMSCLDVGFQEDFVHLIDVNHSLHIVDVDLLATSGLPDKDVLTSNSGDIICSTNPEVLGRLLLANALLEAGGLEEQLLVLLLFQEHCIAPGSLPKHGRNELASVCQSASQLRQRDDQ